MSADGARDVAAFSVSGAVTPEELAAVLAVVAHTGRPVDRARPADPVRTWQVTRRAALRRTAADER